MEKDDNKDHELLIRIDERLLMLTDKITNLESIISKHRTQSNENKERLDQIEDILYGSNNIDGIVQKVDKHDKILTKAIAYFTIIAIVIEFIFKMYLRSGDIK